MTEEQGGDAEAVPAFRITSGNPDAEELAALTAVLSAALAQLATQTRRREKRGSAWQRSQRATRKPLAGDWTHPAG